MSIYSYLLSFQVNQTCSHWQFMGLGLIIVGSLTLKNVSDIDTDHIKSLLDCIQAVSEVTTLSIILIIIGVVIFVFAGLGFFGAYSKRKYILVEVSKILQLKTVLFMVLSVVFSWYRTGFNNKNGNLLFYFMIVNQRNGHCDVVCIVNLSLF